jgi:lipoprotein-releasing system permease protein
MKPCIKLNTENIAVYLIFTLVIVVALFNLIGALIMMILDKKANLKHFLIWERK